MCFAPRGRANICIYNSTQRRGSPNPLVDTKVPPLNRRLAEDAPVRSDEFRNTDSNRGTGLASR